MGSRVAVIDDERSIRELLEVALGQDGFEVRSANDGMEGLKLVREWQPECIVLDIMIPKIDGIALIPHLRRETEVPIIMLTARGDVRDRIEALSVGADDYLAKPFDVGELSVRIHAALRRPSLEHRQYLRYSDLEMDLEAHTVRRGTRAIHLSSREFRLLATLVRRPNRVFTRDELLDLVWGTQADVTPGTVETYISYLRAKVDIAPEVALITTVRGVGYAVRES